MRKHKPVVINTTAGNRPVCFGTRSVGMLLMLVLPALVFAEVSPRNGLEEVDHDRVELADGFWGDRLKRHHQVTVPHALNKCDETGHLHNFDLAAGVIEGRHIGNKAFDSDIYKALEGAIYSLQHFDDSRLRWQVESYLDRIVAAQRADGYLVSCFISTEPGQIWANLRLDHELYNAGHYFEMAVAHHRLSRQVKVLRSAQRFADCIDRTFGPGKRYDVGGHEEVELALIRLYRVTGEKRYLDLCRFFLDERGHAHGSSRQPFDYSTVNTDLPDFDHLPPDERRRAKRRARNSIRNGRMQDHKPLIEQHEAIGHAVRAGYIYSAMADVARFSDAPAYEKAVTHIWTDVVGRKMYLTGGIGTAQYHDEGFGDPYLLPNESAYCESCAAIAHVFWQHRMNLLHADARYADVMELTLYNGMLSGIALSGDRFFYQNPLASKGRRRRSPWIGLACCPTNLSRIIPQVGRFVYARKDDRLYVNLYATGTTTLRGGKHDGITIRQRTDYPWDGRVKLSLNPDRFGEWTLCLRVPGWARGRPVPSDLYRYASPKVPPIHLTVNGKAVDANPKADGYVHLKRTWQAGDVVELELPMPVQRVYAHDKVEANRGKVALMRGPIVYCLEGIDHPQRDLFTLALPESAILSAEYRADLLNGVSVIRSPGRDAEGKAVALTAVPYYAWQNRDTGTMTVWIPEVKSND